MGVRRGFAVLATGLVAVFAAPAAAAPASPPPEPHVVDPAGDADALDGTAGAASQARFDLRSVTLRTVRRGSTFSVTFTMQDSTTVDVAGFHLTGDLDGCGELRIWAAMDPETRRAGAHAAWTCDRLPGRPAGTVNLSAPSVRGRTVVVTVPLSRLHRAMKAGTRYSRFVAGTYVTDPLGTRAPESVPVDDARGTRGYAIAS